MVNWSERVGKVIDDARSNRVRDELAEKAGIAYVEGGTTVIRTFREGGDPRGITTTLHGLPQNITAKKAEQYIRQGSFRKRMDQALNSVPPGARFTITVLDPDQQPTFNCSGVTGERKSNS